MLTRDVTERRDIPHEPGEAMTFRLLSWRQLEQARDAREAAARRSLKDFGAEVVAAIQARAPAIANGQPPVAANGHDAPAVDPEAVAAARRASLENTYDKGMLLRMGIAGWSYPEPVTPDTIDDLDEQTANWAMGCILGIHFMRTEAARKNA